jgi:hypothetical protein
MTPPKDDNTATEKGVLQVDVYGIKVRAQAADSTEPRPTSWKEVAVRINQHLMAIAEGVFGVLAEALDGAKRLIKGTTSIPRAVAGRIESTHKAVEKRESGHQEVLEVFPCDDLYDKTGAALQLQTKLKELRDRGLAAGITLDNDGRPIIFVVRKELSGHVAQIARGTLPPGPERSKHSHS